MSTDDDILQKNLTDLGLSAQKAKETLKNAALVENLQLALHELRHVVLPEHAGLLIYHLATKIKPQFRNVIPFIVQYIASKKLDTTVRVDKAIEFMVNNVNAVDIGKFEEHCGVGVIVTPEQIEREVEEAIKKFKNDLLDKRYRFNFGLIMQEVRGKLPWADGKAVKSEIDVQVLLLLGSKTVADLAPVVKTKKEPAPKTVETQIKCETDEKPTQNLTIEDVMKKIDFHKPGENYKTNGYVITPFTHTLLEKHLQETDGQVRTRFPPEPNGILHIGHAKAININFGYARAHNGTCYLRYDDTNPEKEEEKFFVGILDMVRWLGYEPARITHSSDYFDQLYAWAVVLIEKGHAYVCHQTVEDMRGQDAKLSPWRDRPVAESLQLFQDMKNGKFEEGEATLRMRITLEEGKMDPVAYRIRYLPHPRTGDKWCIYPTYDYTHCLCDSIENITHSLCTKEFQSRRSSYYWLCNALDLYCPVQWEYGRLNVNYTVVSKRKIAKLIDERIVNDWDDPRLFTLTALRRRGFPASALNNFCAQLGVTGAQGVVDPSMLEAFVRDELNVTAKRCMTVLEPLKVTITNFPKHLNELTVPDFPAVKESPVHTIHFARVIYIERSDFRETFDKNYRRLAPSQSVGLRHAGYVLEHVDTIKNDRNEIIELVCACQPVTSAIKPKAFIHWVAKPVVVQVRLYDTLFNHKNPEDTNEVPGGFLTDCNRDSLTVIDAYADCSVVGARVFEKFQFERVGFFSVDPDTTDRKMIFNRTVTLKEDTGK